MTQLVDYRSSDSDSDTPEPPPKRRKTSPDLPPLPPEFHILYPTAPRRSTTDDPSLHDGRERQIPHLPGYYPAHVFLEWHPPAPTIAHLNAIISCAKSECPTLTSLLTSPLGVDLPLHLSLSRPNILHRDERARFVEHLTAAVGQTRTFKVGFGGAEWWKNETGTRWFFVLSARVLSCDRGEDGHGGESGDGVLEMLVRKCNRAFEGFDQKTLPESGFHVSLGWTLSEPDDGVKKRIAERVEGLDGVVEGLEWKVEDLRIKLGNVVHRVEFSR